MEQQFNVVIFLSSLVVYFNNFAKLTEALQGLINSGRHIATINDKMLWEF